MHTILSELTPLLTKGKYADAAHLLQRHLSQHPADHELWLKLATIAKQANLAELHHQAQTQYQLVSYYNHRLYLADQALRQRQLKECGALLNELLRDVPGEFRALALYAELAIACGDYDAATEIFETLNLHNYAHPQLHHRAVQHLAAAKQFNKALLVSQQIPLQQLIATPETALAVAQSYVKTAKLEQAEQLYILLSQTQRLKAFVTQRLGHLKAFIGDSDRAAAYYTDALETEPENTESYWYLANLKTYSFNEQQIARMEQLQQTDLPLQHQIFLLFALAKVKEQQHNWTEACRYYQQANGLLHKPGQHHTLNDSLSLRDYFSRHPVAQKAAGSSGLIFILGLPRTGSTLLEQMLASHPQIDASHEIPEITSIARMLESRKTDSSPYGLATLSEQQKCSLAQRYLDYVAPLRQQGRYLIDKLPANCNHIGLIKTLFPDAKIIEMTRDPIATGWSLFRHLFAEGHLYANNLQDIGQYYLNYEQMMQFWRQQLGTQLYSISYEELLQAPETHLQLLMQYLELEFHPGCMQFHQTARAIQTPSTMQVRQPLYTSALTDWLQVSDFLEPLITKVQSGRANILS